ncbi:N-acetylmuramoyl-L-alanine amidase [Macrococcus hajekii]|uniref:N-acetylmuramoyl-L-alanine amidase n=1 Tax=Macrococcus hajekii TaxID=198482 RepID=A0A4V3BEQ8_9STAP|nr:N-acetylmuramoyl-L-alanine amidase [Macrococcus hajekii]TDM03525.1 N-acetylmuramoyl-L-alanine amidase [Macrococcus hajekii]GGA99536.1 amidase [Macrococcus hajekii]
MKTNKELSDRLDWYIGKYIDPDKKYGFQCADVPTDLLKWATGILMTGNARDLIYNDFKGMAEVIVNTPELEIKKGDILIYSLGRFDNKYGHVAIAYKNITLQSCIVLEQNWDDDADTPVTPRLDYYEGLSHVIRIKTTGGNKMKIMLVSGHGYHDPGAVGNGTNERDFIREQIVDRVAKYLKIAGHDVTLYSKSQDMYQDTAYGENRPDRDKYGIFWVKKQGYDAVIEFHLDASANPEVDGGHVVIGAGLVPDNIDTGIQAAIDKHVDVVYSISKRDDLAHPRIAKAIGLNYRLVELGFITNKGDMDYMKQHGEEFCKDIADAINGKEIIVPGELPQIDEVKTVIKTAAQTKNPPKTSPFPLNLYRARSEDAYISGRLTAKSTVYRRSGRQGKGYNWNRKAPYTLNKGDVVYIFETHNGMGRIYTGDLTGKGANDWVKLDQIKIEKVYKK